MTWRTFYLHYNSLDELLSVIEDQLQHDLTISLGKANSIKTIVENLNQLMLNNEKFYQNMLNRSPNLFLVDDLLLMLRRGLASKFSKLNPEPYTIDFISGGIIQAYRQYLQEQKQDQKKLIKSLSNLLERILK